MGGDTAVGSAAVQIPDKGRTLTADRVKCSNPEPKISGPDQNPASVLGNGRLRVVTIRRDQIADQQDRQRRRDNVANEQRRSARDVRQSHGGPQGEGEK